MKYVSRNINSDVVPWNRGETKYTHSSLMRLSQKLAKQNKWNFSQWQKKRRISINYKIEKSETCAELIGVVLGDGHVERYPRMERLWVTCNSAEDKYIQHIIDIVEIVFHKKPKMRKKGPGAADIYIYQCRLSKRLEIPTGNKIKNNVGVPEWVKRKRIFIIKCLKGLFETDGCFQQDLSNYAQFIEFKNHCHQLIADVYYMLQRLSYHPQLGKNYVRLARKKEVSEFKKLIDFRNY